MKTGKLGKRIQISVMLAIVISCALFAILCSLSCRTQKDLPPSPEPTIYDPSYTVIPPLQPSRRPTCPEPTIITDPEPGATIIGPLRPTPKPTAKTRGRRSPADGIYRIW